MSAPPADVNYTFSDKEIAMLRPYGEVRRHEEGEIVIQEGERATECMVVLSGQLDAHIHEHGQARRVGWMTPGQFPGDMSVLTGQTVMVTGTMAKAGEVLHIPRENFQRLLVENSALSDIFVRAFAARRAWARESGNAAIVVLGARYDRGVFAIRDLMQRHSLAHVWLDIDSDPLAISVMQARGLTAADCPAVLHGSSGILRKPDIAALSEFFGLDLLPDGACADVIVVGAGPGGLAASVYAASEGLSVLTLDTDGPGGQAGASSKIENYLGFPTGISGRELAERASLQAQKFGARIASTAKASALEKLDDYYCLRLADGRALKGRAVIIATGAQYRRLDVDNVERFEGRGLYYGATPMEAQLCADAEIAIVGAGNSAGQGAVYLSSHASKVHLLYRRADIRETMSEYLVRRMEETPNIVLHPESEISALQGVDGADMEDDRLVSVETLRGGKAGDPLQTPFVFLFIGASPFTAWLPDTVARDNKGFLKSGSDLSNLELVRAGWPLDRMPSRYETSWPRIYAVGDVRTGSVKRVASAVGEGSVVVSDVHKALHEAAPA